MSQLLRLFEPRKAPVPADEPSPELHWNRASDSARAVAARRLGQLRPLLALVSQGWPRSTAARHLAPPPQKKPSCASLLRWHEDYLAANHAAGLLPGWRRPFAPQPWHAVLIEMVKTPPKRAVSTYWEKLVGMGFECEYHQVLRYYKSLPKTVRDYSPSLVGRHEHRQNYTPYVIRDRNSIEPGRVWQGDGHQFHFFIAHPATGTKHKFEITRWIDIGSLKNIGYWISECESGLTTLYSLAESMRRLDHVPDLIHVDPGPGFNNELIQDDVVGLKARLGFEVMFAHVGNARGKGDIEGSFRWLEEKVGRDFDTHDAMPREHLRKLDSHIKHGRVVLRDLNFLKDKLDDYFRRQDEKPREVFGGRSANEMWTLRERNPLLVSVDDLLSQEKTPVVSKNGRIVVLGRIYENPALLDYRKEKLRAQFDFEDMSQVKVRTPDGRLICEAHRVDAKTWLTDSRSQELREKRVAGQRKRMQRRDEENTAKASRVLSAVDAVNALEAPADPAAGRPANAGTQLLAQGHSLTPPTVPVRAARPPRSIDPRAIAFVHAAMAEEAQPLEEAPHQRFARWLALRERAQAGDPLDGEASIFLSAYAQSAECQGHLFVHESELSQ